MQNIGNVCGQSCMVPRRITILQSRRGEYGYWAYAPVSSWDEMQKRGPSSGLRRATIAHTIVGYRQNRSPCLRGGGGYRSEALNVQMRMQMQIQNSILVMHCLCSQERQRHQCQLAKTSAGGRMSHSFSFSAMAARQRSILHSPTHAATSIPHSSQRGRKRQHNTRQKTLNIQALTSSDRPNCCRRLKRVPPVVIKSQYKNSRAFASSTTHASPSLRFSPVIALHRNIFHWCVLISASRRPCMISPSSMQPATSDLLANTRRLAPASRCMSPDKDDDFVSIKCMHGRKNTNQKYNRKRGGRRGMIGRNTTPCGMHVRTSSCSSPCSSSRQSSILRRSVTSTTHIRASVFSK